MADAGLSKGLGGSVGAMVLDYLQRHDTSYSEGPNGVLVVPLAESIPGSPWQAWFATSAAGSPALVVQVRAAHRVARARWSDAIEICNAWNRAVRLTKAWLAVQDWNESPDGTYVVEATLPAADQAEQSMIDEFISAALAGAVDFWRAHLRSMWQGPDQRSG